MLNLISNDLMGQDFSSRVQGIKGLFKKDPCLDLFEAYLRCAEAHAGVHPEEYGEYCEEEKQLYLECRNPTESPKKDPD